MPALHGKDRRGAREGAVSMEREIASRRSGILARHGRFIKRRRIFNGPVSGKYARPTSHREIAVRGKTSLERRHPAGFVGFLRAGRPCSIFRRNPNAIAPEH
jgi:hypothetical protein